MARYTLDQIAELRDPRYILFPCLPERSIVLIHGHPGLGKSTLVLGWLMALAHGQPWIDQPTAPMQVLYVWTEGHHGDVKKRHAAVLAEMRCKPSPNYLWESEPVNLLSDSEVTVLIEGLIAAKHYPEVIAFDSFHMNTAGAEENSARDMGMALASVYRLREEFNCSVILVHHSRKDGEAERGHTSLKAAVDTQIVVKGSDKSPVIWVNSEKVRGGAPFHFPLERTVVSTEWGTTVVLRDHEREEESL